MIDAKKVLLDLTHQSKTYLETDGCTYSGIATVHDHGATCRYGKPDAEPEPIPPSPCWRARREIVIDGQRFLVEVTKV